MKTPYHIPFLALSVTALFAIFPMTARAQVTGNSSGDFTTYVPDGSSPDVKETSTNGKSNNNIAWGNGTPPSSLNFASAIITNQPYETPFKIGSITYHNGSITLGTGITSVDMAITLDFTDPAIGSHTFTYQVNTVSTPNSGNVVQAADYIYLGNVFSNETITVNSNTYHLQVTGFQNFSGDAVSHVDLTNPANHITTPTGPDYFYVYEDSAAGHTGTGTADLYGELTVNSAVVPEPSTAFGSGGLLALGYFLALIARRRNAC